MNKETNPVPQNAETISTAITQRFEDDGGLPLDNPIVRERERNRKGTPQKQPVNPPDKEVDGK